MSFQFGDSKYQVTDVFSIDLEKIVVSKGSSVNKHDMRYTIGYKVNPTKVIPLYIKTPKNCWSSGVSRYNENSPWKMGFNVGEDSTWINQYKAIFDRVEELLFQKLSGTPLNNEKYINPKLIMWNGDMKTRFNGCYCVPFDRYCEATGVLKISSV